MKRWDELLTALYVHELGTVSAAAEALNVHRATIIRHIDMLEEELGLQLFLRHAQGYTATRAGVETLGAVKQAERIFERVSRRLRGELVDDAPPELILSVLPAVSPLVLPGVGAFLESREGARVSVDSSIELLQLEFGEADVAVRGGPEPLGSGLKSELLLTAKMRLYATDAYLLLHGRPRVADDLQEHIVVGPTSDAAGPIATVAGRLIPSRSMRLQVGTADMALAAATASIGIAFLPDFIGDQHAELEVIELPETLQPEKFWLLTHRESQVNGYAEELAESIRDNCPVF